MQGLLEIGLACPLDPPENGVSANDPNDIEQEGRGTEHNGSQTGAEEQRVGLKGIPKGEVESEVDGMHQRRSVSEERYTIVSEHDRRVVPSLCLKCSF